MKNLIILGTFIGVALLGIAGCSRQESPTGPEVSAINASHVITPMASIDPPRKPIGALVLEDPLITGDPVPTAVGLSAITLRPIAYVRSITSDTRLIHPTDKEKTLSATLRYRSADDRDCEIIVEFRVPQGAVSSPVTITMSLDTVSAEVYFQPEGLRFVKPALLSYYTAQAIMPIPDNSVVKFVYLNLDGTYEEQLFESLSVLGSSGKIDLRKAQINHFSRYGFGRIDE